MKDSLNCLDGNVLLFLLHGIYTRFQGFHATDKFSVISAGWRFHAKPQVCKCAKVLEAL
jgi:hypothetical protein